MNLYPVFNPRPRYIQPDVLLRKELFHMLKCYVVNIYGEGVKSPDCNVTWGGGGGRRMLCYILLWGSQRGKGKLVTARKPAPLVQSGATKLNAHFIFMFRDSFRFILIVIPDCHGRGGG
jgi:hypothetical protein